MKKFISVILAFMTVIIPCFITANAYDDGQENTVAESTSPADESPADETGTDGEFSDYGAILCRTGNKDNVCMIAFDSEFKTFSDDINITINYRDGSSVECENMYTYIDDFNEGGFCGDWPELEKRLIIYLTGMVEFEIISVVLHENAAFDSEGKGNSEQTFEGGYINLSHSFHSSDYNYLKGDVVTYSTIMPTDFYIDGQLVAENARTYSLKIEKSEDHVVSIKNHDIEMIIDDIDVSQYKENSLEYLAEMTGEAFLGILLSPVAFISSPLLMIFPLLGITAVFSPITSVSSFFIMIAEFVRVALM